MKVFIQLFFVLIALHTTMPCLAQVPVPTPAVAQAKAIVLTNATIHVGNGSVINGGYVAFDKGIIRAVGEGNPSKGLGEVKDLKGKHLYPGFILPASTLGLREIDALRQSLDYNEVGAFKPSVRSVIAYNAESEIIPTLKFNGILLAQVAPEGGYIAGQSSVMQLDAWNWDDAAYATDEGMWFNWPDMYQFTGWWAEPGGIKKAEKRDEEIAKIKSFLQESSSFCKANSNVVKDNLPYRAMCRVMEGKQRAYIRVGGAQEIMEAVLFFKSMGISNPVIVGAKEAWRVAGFLSENKIDVILSSIHDLPTFEDDDVDMNYRMPKLLHEKGVRFCLSVEPVRELMGSRNLPFFAGNSVGYGMNKEEALKTITLNAAEILGISHRTGSIEKGKEANLFISEGDALDMRSNKVSEAFILGRSLDLKGKQQALYEKFLNKEKTSK